MNSYKQAAFGALIISASMLVSCGGGKPDYKVSLKNDVDSASYYIGYFNAKQMTSQGFDEYNTDAMAKGWQDAKNDVKLNENDEQIGMFMQRYFTGMQARAKEKQAKESEKILKDGKDFLEANKTKEGVVTLPDGLQYKVIKNGTGVKPTKDDLVDVVYHGTLIDGKVFDSSKEQGDTVSFDVSGVVPGFSEALTLMSEGSGWEVYIPSELGYGTNVRPGGPIKPNSTLIFEINLVKVNKQEPVEEK